MLLLDEPLSALDAKVRGELRSEISQLQRSLGIPSLMVTHDQEEAMALADKVICMNHGVVVQAGSAEDLYHRPATRFVADFMGTSNLIETPRVRAVRPELLAERPAGADDAYTACIRPEQITLTPTREGQSRVRAITFLGNLHRIEVEDPMGHLTVEAHGDIHFAEGEAVAVGISPEVCTWVANDMDAEAGR